MIGGGIFTTPRGVLEQVGSVGGTLVIWTLGGFYAMCLAFCYSELAAIMPEAGLSTLMIYK